MFIVLVRSLTIRKFYVVGDNKMCREDILTVQKKLKRGDYD